MLLAKLEMIIAAATESNKNQPSQSNDNEVNGNCNKIEAQKSDEEIVWEGGEYEEREAKCADIGQRNTGRMKGVVNGGE